MLLSSLNEDRPLRLAQVRLKEFHSFKALGRNRGGVLPGGRGNGKDFNPLTWLAEAVRQPPGELWGIKAGPMKFCLGPPPRRRSARESREVAEVAYGQGADQKIGGPRRERKREAVASYESPCEHGLGPRGREHGRGEVDADA